MLILSPEEASPGMTLALTVPNPKAPDQDLLKRGYQLERDVLRRLTDMGIEFLYVDFPDLGDLDRHLAPHLNPVRQQVYEQVKDVVKSSQRALKPSVPFAEYYATIRELITTLFSQGQNPVYLDQVARLGDDLVQHSAAVAHLALTIGVRLQRYLVQERFRLPPGHAREVVNLGIAGMLHDIGKTRLPQRLQHFTGIRPPTDNEAREEWETHSRLGYEVVRDGVEASAASAVLHHHQHVDGTGFPTTVHKDGAVSPLEGSRIHVFARIVHVADLYDRLACSVADRGRLSNLQVLHLLRKRFCRWCDGVILRALHDVTPPFPPGSKVTLEDGSSAVVTRIDPVDPYRPVIQRIDPETWKLQGEPIDLRLPTSPCITHIGPVAVAGLIPPLDELKKLGELK